VGMVLNSRCSSGPESVWAFRIWVKVLNITGKKVSFWS